MAAYFYNTPTSLTDVYWQLLYWEENSHQRIVFQDRIGEHAALFPAGYVATGPALIFRRCRTVIEIKLSANVAEPIILAYATRLDERLVAVDCQNVASVPVFTPAPLSSTPTPAPPSPIAEVISATVHHLPDPYGTTTIHAYNFADADHGWLALGTTILTTGDGGQSWQSNYEVDSRVKAITFISLQVGWIETEAGYVLTEDSGASWQKAAAPPDDGKATMAEPELLALPGDLFWETAKTYKFCPEDVPIAGDFTAVDLQTGWAFCFWAEPHFSAQQLFKTEDDGEHWRLLTDQVPEGSLFFLDRKHGWVTARGGVYTTEDGGATWRKLPIISSYDDWANAPQFLSPQSGFIIVNEYNRNERRDTLLRTDDGGETWQEVFAAPPLPLRPFGLTRFFSDGSGIGASGEVFSTTDAGRNWAHRPGTYSGPCNGTIAVNNFDLSFVNRQHGWATISCGEAYRLPALYETTDSGDTWAVLSVPSDENSSYEAVSFVDEQTGYVVTREGRLLRTDDGGRNFVPVDGLAVHTVAIQLATRDVGWEVRDSQLFRTMDGGHSWELINLGYRVQEQFTLLPDGHGWVVNSGLTLEGDPEPNRVLFATSDNGQTWAQYNLGHIQPFDRWYVWLDGVQFADVVHGWLREGGALYYTEDGGLSWFQLY